MQLDLNLPRHMIDKLDNLSGCDPLRSYIRKVLQQHIDYNGSLSATDSHTDTGIIINEENKDESIRPCSS